MSSTPAGLHIQFDEQQPVHRRPTPLYGNVVSLSSSTGECTILTYPSSKSQARKQGKWAETYIFKLSELPATQQSGMLKRAIQHWVEEIEQRRTASGKLDEHEEDACGPRVTFFDEKDILAFRGELPPPLPTKNGSDACTEPQKKLRHHHQHRRRASRSQEAGAKRAVDVGLVWWTDDLHGKHM